MTSPNWTVETLAPADGLGPHRAAWSSLNQHLAASHPMLDGAFVDGLLRHFGGKGVYLCTARRASTVVAMCLLRRHALGFGMWASFLPSQAEIGPTLIGDPTLVASLFGALPGYAAQIDWLCNDPKFGDLRECSRTSTRVLPHALTIDIAMRGSFDDYWAQRPRKLIQNMRRYQRRLQSEVGEVRYAAITESAGLAAAVDRYARLESQGWKGRLGTAVAPGNAQGQFYAELMRAFGSRGKAVVYELWLGDELLASRMLIIQGQMAVMLKTAFSETHERFAPGRILLQRSLEDLFGRLPGGVVEFCTNADQDLLAWSTSQRWVNHVSVYRHGGLNLAYGLIRRSTRSWRHRSGRQRLDADAMASRSGATVETYSHPRELPADALALMAKQEERHIEFGADWFANLIDTVYPNQPPVQILVLRRQSRILAVLPTLAQQGSLGREHSSLSNFYTAIYAPSIDHELQAEDLLPLTLALRRQGNGAATYRFSPMDPASREFALLAKALRLAGLSTHRYFAFGNWYLKVEQTWAEYLRARSGQVRNTIKRMGKRFAAEGGRLEIFRSGDEIEAKLAAFQTVYGQSWKIPEPYPGFIPGLIRLCARRGWLRLGLAWLGDKPVAAQIWIVANGRADIYKLAYDEAHKALAPGTLLTATLMEMAIDQDRVTEIDYLIGDDPYKKAWMSHRRERFGLVAFDPLTLRGLLGLTKQHLADLLRPTREWWARRREPSPQANNSALPPDTANA